jgi:dsRNA-specific ribonuclease
MLARVLEYANIKPEYAEYIAENDGDSLFKSIVELNPDLYPFYKMLGNATLNKCVVSYMPQRFPVLQHPSRVNVLAPLKIHIISNEIVSERFNEIFNISAIIPAAAEELRRDKSPINSMFKAILGCVESVVDKNIKEGLGYRVCYNLIKNLLEQIPLSLKYTDLVSPNTRINEIVNRNHLRKLEEATVEGEGETLTNVYKITLKGRTFKGEIVAVGRAKGKKEARAIANQQALDSLERVGLVRETPPEFRDL